MTPMTVDAWALTVPVDHAIARSRIRYSDHVVVRVGDGWGAAPLYARSHHEVPALLDHRVRPFLREHAGAAPRELRALAQQALAAWPDVLNALDQALWDAEALAAGVPVASLLDEAPAARVRVTAQLFAMDPAGAAAAAGELVRAHGCSRLKVKVTGEPTLDLALVAAVRDEVGDDVALRLDANRGYGLADADAVAEPLHELGVADWEEPADASFDELASLRRNTPLRITLDESLRDDRDVERALASEAADAVNLKLSRIGGLSAASRWRALCARHGVAVSLGCAEDLGPAMWAILHAAAAWRPRETEGVGWMRLGLDLAGPRPEISNGSIALADGAGWGGVIAPEITSLGRGGRPPRLLPEAEWDARFRTQSRLRHQRQRAENARLRVRRWLRTRATAG